MLKNSLGIFTSRSLLLSIAFLISACSGLGSSDSSRSSAGPDREYLGWHCQGAIESSDQWHCSEQLLKGGELVSPVQVEAETVESNFSEINSPEIDSSEINSSEINSSEINSPEPAETVPDTSAPKAELVEEVAKDKPLTKVMAFDIGANGYTVQLGAYLTQAVAEQAADNISLVEGELRIRTIADGERYLFVVVYGQYPSRQQAEQATAQLVELNPQLDFWIRTIGSIRQAD
ncbi:SPOR domain-containing protein [Porticoccaceae bacterium]|nr:SPOR domain-containing protein [Porticoccaceae bacterium]MDB9805599.1 SPOR domain-containing protein [Porticoccaceae bacterium]MDB9992891.1 SPOR domain-containing protein [Porticoccaceae bacterium]